MAESLKDLGAKAVALVVLLLAAFILFKVVLGVLSALAWTLLGVAALVALVWAASRFL
jgi:hypothetical protein